MCLFMVYSTIYGFSKEIEMSVNRAMANFPGSLESSTSELKVRTLAALSRSRESHCAMS